jgi:hypothetical protein
MKGFKVWFGKDKDNCMYSLFKTRKEAGLWVKNMETTLAISKRNGIVPVEVKECRCGRLYQPSTGCLTCEKIMYDAQCDKELYETD